MSAKVIFDFARNSKEVERRREWRHVSPVRVYFASNECSDLRSLILQGGMLFRVNGHTDRIIIRYQAQWPRLSVILSKFLSNDLVDNNGAKVHPSWFGSGRKKDTVVVSTLFGILAKAVRGKKPQDDKVIGSLEFQMIKDLINSTPIDEMAGRSEIPAIFPETPPTSAEDKILPEVIKPCNIESTLAIKQPFEALKEFEMCQMGPRLRMKRAGLVANECLAVLQQELTSFAPDLGKVFGYGLLHCAKDNQNYVREVISTALETVAEKQGIKKAFGTILCEDLNTRYLESLRVPHWLQLYVKLTTKLPNRSWQTLLNFLNIGRSGVSFIFTSFLFLDNQKSFVCPLGEGGGKLGEEI